MYCNRCSAYIPDDAEFCPQCGARQNIAPRGTSGSKNGIIIGAIAAVAVVLVVCIVCFTVVLKGNQDAQLAAQQNAAATEAQQAAQAQNTQSNSGNTASTSSDSDASSNAGTPDTEDQSDSESTTTVTNNYYYYGTGAVRDNNYYTKSVSSGYLWPTDTQYISSSDLRGLSEDTVAAIRNEIYARHGYAFTTAHWQDYFAAKTWYRRDNSCTESTINRRLSSLERANIDTIVAYEESQGWR